MAQQASPNVAGKTDALRTQPAACSTAVSRKALGSFSSSPMLKGPSVPFQAAAPPYVRVRDEDGEHEEQHLHEPENTQGVEGDGPGVEEDDLDVEDDEEHRRQVVLDGEAPAAGRRGGRLDPALVGFEPGAVVPLRTDQRGHDHGEDRKACPEGSQYEDGRIRVHRSSLLSVGTDCWRWPGFTPTSCGSRTPPVADEDREHVKQVTSPTASHLMPAAL